MHITICQPDSINLYLNETEKDVRDTLLSIIADRNDICWVDDRGFFEMSSDAYNWLYTEYHQHLSVSQDICDATDSIKDDKRSIVDNTNYQQHARKTFSEKTCQTDVRVFNTLSTQTEQELNTLLDTMANVKDRQSTTTQSDVASVNNDSIAFIQPMDTPIMHKGLRNPTTYTTSEVSAPSVMSGYDLGTQPHALSWPT